MSGSLFNEYEAMTPEGQAIAREFSLAISPLFAYYLGLGHKGRELECLAYSAVSGDCAAQVLKQASQKYAAAHPRLKKVNPNDVSF